MLTARSPARRGQAPGARREWGARVMIGLLFWVVVGAALLFVVPPLIAPYTGGNPVVGVGSASSER